MPSSYQAVATYSGKVYYSAATSYITTADYVGEVTREGVESVTYQVTYLGTEAQSDSFTGQVISAFASIWPYLLGGGGVAAIVILSLLLARARREASQLRTEQEALPQETYEESEEEEKE